MKSVRIFEINKTLQSLAFLYIISVVLLVTYFTYLRYAALAQYNSRINRQLRSVSEETKILKRKMDTYFTEGGIGRSS